MSCFTPISRTPASEKARTSDFFSSRARQPIMDHPSGMCGVTEIMVAVSTYFGSVALPSSARHKGLFPGSLSTGLWCWLESPIDSLTMPNSGMHADISWKVKTSQFLASTNITSRFGNVSSFPLCVRCLPSLTSFHAWTVGEGLIEKRRLVIASFREPVEEIGV
jgi:hypothetical protein